MEVVRDLGYLQLDPIGVVAPSPYLILWSRLGAYARSDLDALLWEERRLVEDWGHGESFLPTEDWPILAAIKRLRAAEETAGRRRVREWAERNASLRRSILRRLHREGAIPMHAFEDKAEVVWQSGGWTSGRNVERMLYYLKRFGTLMVAGRTGRREIWDLTERWLPSWAPRERLGRRQLALRITERSLRALGIARRRDLPQNYLWQSYAALDRALRDLQREGRVVQVAVREGSTELSGPWYVHADDLPLLERLRQGDWQPRTELLSPFDNLLIDRRRAEDLFGFHFRMEIYVPKTDRKHGYYVMPVLYGDRLIARLDPAMDRTHGVLRVHAVHAERDAPATQAVGRAIRRAVDELAGWLGARDVEFSRRVPRPWAQALR